MKITRSFLRSSLLALGLTVAASGAFADGGPRAAEPTAPGAICQTCQPHNAAPFEQPHDQTHRAEPAYRPGMVPVSAPPQRIAPPPAAAPLHQQVPGIVILLGSF